MYSYDCRPLFKYYSIFLGRAERVVRSQGGGGGSEGKYLMATDVFQKIQSRQVLRPRSVVVGVVDTVVVAQHNTDRGRAISIPSVSW